MYLVKNGLETISSGISVFVPDGSINHWITTSGITHKVPDLNREYTQEWDGPGDGGTFETDWSNTPDTSKKYRTLMSATDVKTLFTIQERLAIRQAREYTGSDTDELNKKYVLDDLFSIFENSSHVNANHPSFIEAIQYLENESFITSERANIIVRGVETP